MSEALKIFPFNSDKSYLLSMLSKRADGKGSLGDYINKNKGSVGGASAELPFAVAAGIGNGGIYKDEKATRFFFILETTNGEFACGLRTDAGKSDGEPLNIIKVKNGDYFTVPKGTPYMISEGVSYVEAYSLQNNLHLIETREELLKSVNAAEAAPHLKKPAFANENEGFSVKLLCTCERFTAAQISIVGAYKNTVSPSSFKFIFCLDGGAHIHTAGEHIDIKAGDCYFFPAGIGEFEIVGGVELLIFGK